MAHNGDTDGRSRAHHSGPRPRAAPRRTLLNHRLVPTPSAPGNPDIANSTIASHRAVLTVGAFQNRKLTIPMPRWPTRVEGGCAPRQPSDDERAGNTADGHRAADDADLRATAIESFDDEHDEQHEKQALGDLTDANDDDQRLRVSACDGSRRVQRERFRRTCRRARSVVMRRFLHGSPTRPRPRRRN